MVSISKNPDLKYRFSLLSMFVSFLAVLFMLNFLKGISENVVKSKMKLEETKRDIALLDKISRDRNQYRNDINKIRGTLPSEYYEFSFFTDQLETLAKNNNLTLESTIDKKKKDDKQKYDSVIYLANLTGSYSSVASFLSQVSKLPYHTSVDQLKIAMDEKVLETEIKFNVYIAK